MKSNLTGVIDALNPAAVGSFNTLEPEMAQAVLDAAGELDIPVIIGVATRHYRSIRAPLLAPALVRAIEQASVPAALHLDHAAPDELDLIREALDLGFSSIMIDGSRLPFEENVAVTAKVVEMARPYDAGVEGELGGIAGEEGVADTGDDSPESLPYTDADEAKRFVAQTGIDALAIAVGTAHGIYKQTPHIRTYSTIHPALCCAPEWRWVGPKVQPIAGLLANQEHRQRCSGAQPEGPASRGPIAVLRLAYLEIPNSTRRALRCIREWLAQRGLNSDIGSCNETIEKVAAAVDVPLVMHGATGVSDSAIQQSVRSGIRKINYFSGLLQTAMDHVREGKGREDNDYLGFKQGMADRWRRLAAEQMRLYALR